MTDAREQVIAGLEAAIRDPHCPLQYSPLLMQAQKLLRALAPPEPTEGQFEAIRAALKPFADAADRFTPYHGQMEEKEVNAFFTLGQLRAAAAVLRAMPLQEDAK